MIVRIMGEGQYRLDAEHLGHINAIDERLTRALERGDRAAFDAEFPALVSHIREHGEQVPHTELVASEVVIPPADAGFEEVRDLVGADGLVPG